MDEGSSFHTTVYCISVIPGMVISFSLLTPSFRAGTPEPHPSTSASETSAAPFGAASPPTDPPQLPFVQPIEEPPRGTNVHVNALGLLQFGLIPRVEFGGATTLLFGVHFFNTGILSYSVIPGDATGDAFAGRPLPRGVALRQLPAAPVHATNTSSPRCDRAPTARRSA